jgi:hypothetical protein
MPSRFPFLKSKRDPYGLVEQFGIAVTIDPETDGSPDAAFSWFGTTLEPVNTFTMTYTGEDGKKDTVSGHKAITYAYSLGEFRYQAYDWKITLLQIDPAANTGVVEGTVSIKGRCDLCTNNPVHRGDHSFKYIIARAGAKEDWLVRAWSLEKLKTAMGVVNPLVNFLREDI